MPDPPQPPRGKLRYLRAASESCAQNVSDIHGASAELDARAEPPGYSLRHQQRVCQDIRATPEGKNR